MSKGTQWILRGNDITCFYHQVMYLPLTGEASSVSKVLFLRRWWSARDIGPGHKTTSHPGLIIYHLLRESICHHWHYNVTFQLLCLIHVHNVNTISGVVLIQAHLKKLFAGIHSVKFNEDEMEIIAMRSLDGEEVPLSKTVPITSNVEVSQSVREIVGIMVRE